MAEKAFRVTLLLVLTGCLAGLIGTLGCSYEEDDDDDHEYADDDDGAKCEYLCDEIYDCGLDVQGMSEPECAESCDLDQSWWRCIKACMDANSCEAQSCIESCE